jgi:RNA polymerase sigma-70 factor (ECF subfamily)
MSNPNTTSRFDEIYDSTNKAVLAFITAKCGRITDVGDIFQETYMELFRILSKRGVGYITNEKALVMRLAKQQIARHYSLMERLRIFVSATLAEDNDEADFTDLEADVFLTEDIAVDNVMYETARQFIKSKPEDVQKVFYLMYDVGLTIPEIAQTLSIKESGVKNKLYRTLKELRNLLSERW